MVKSNVLENRFEIRPCTGCGVCVISCPYNCITISVDNEGFLRPSINDKCVHCGLCVKTCVKYDSSLSTDKSILNGGNIYSYKNKDKAILLDSSSGGFVGLVYRHYLQREYKICGAFFDYEINCVRHKIVQNINELQSLLGSKYLQSYTESCLLQIKEENAAKFIFVGTPCQVYGLDKWAKLHNRRSQFVLIDFFCAGIPSYLLWQSYIEYVKTKFSIGEIKFISFRDKMSGWHKYGMHIIGTTGEYYMPSATSNDIFFQFYLSDCCKQASCCKNNCLFRKQNCFSDIRVGDYWGDLFKDDTSGVSVVIANTNVGEKIVHELQLEEEPCGIIIGDLKEQNEKRSDILSLLANNTPLCDIEKFIFKQQLLSKLKNKLISIINGK